jgi:hypothetical protein
MVEAPWPAKTLRVRWVGRVDGACRVWSGGRDGGRIGWPCTAVHAVAGGGLVREPDYGCFFMVRGSKVPT